MKETLLEIAKTSLSQNLLPCLDYQLKYQHNKTIPPFRKEPVKMSNAWKPDPSINRSNIPSTTMKDFENTPHYNRTEFFPESGMPLCVMHVPQTGSQFHDHDFTELVVVTQGKGRHATESEEYPMGVGDIFVIQAHEKHSYQYTHNLELYNVLFDLDKLNLPMDDLKRMPGFQALFTIEPRLRTLHGFRSRLNLPASNLAIVHDLIANIDKELAQKRPGYKSFASALFLQTIGFLSRCYSSIEDPESRALLRLGAVLDHMEFAMSRHIALEELARIAHMSPSTFKRAFKRALNASPIDYLIRMRIRKASDLLTDGKTSVKEVADAVGFDDSNYFTRQFRNITGLSPRTFQRRNCG